MCESLSLTGMTKFLNFLIDITVSIIILMKTLT